MSDNMVTYQVQYADGSNSHTGETSFEQALSDIVYCIHKGDAVEALFEDVVEETPDDTVSKEHHTLILSNDDGTRSTYSFTRKFIIS